MHRLVWSLPVIMNLNFSDKRLFALTLGCLLAGCGGGSSDTSSSPGPVTYPTTGTYGWVVKPTGSTSAPDKGLSLVHRDVSDTEYVIEAPSQHVSTGPQPVYAGAVTASQQTVGSLQAQTLVYIVGGDVRSVSLQADGTDPKGHVQSAGTSSACSFVITANDYATPQNSRFIVSTAGTDGVCGTGDDGRAEVQLSAGMVPILRKINGLWPLAFVRDPVTLAPNGWIDSLNLTPWSTPGASVPLRQNGAPITSVIASTAQSALVSDGKQLSLLTFGANNSVTESLLDATLTKGNGWHLIGFDAGGFYVANNFLGDGGDPSLAWAALKIDRSTLKVTALSHPVATDASDSGQLGLASMGRGVLYLQVLGTAQNYLVRIQKSDGTQSATPVPVDTALYVQTSATDVHQQYLATHINGPDSDRTYEVQIVDETGASQYAAKGGQVLSMAEASAINLNVSENRTRFVFATGFNAASAFAGTTLVSYDTMARSATNLGVLPSYGGDYVDANASAGPGGSGAGWSAHSFMANLVAADARAFSFDLGVANSLTLTTHAH